MAAKLSGVGYNAYFEDTEGNPFGMHESDASAE
jgi:predicted enzyme related to lactoylglutathione lyase